MRSPLKYVLSCSFTEILYVESLSSTENVKLGDGKDNAIEMLRLFIKALQGSEEMIEETIEAEEDEIPF